MDKFWKTIRYLVRSLTGMILIGCFSMLINAGIADLIALLTRKDGFETDQISGNMEGTAIIFVLLIGIIFSSVQFEVLLANGISRKTFFWANLPAFAVISAILALFIALITLAHRFFLPMVTMVQAVYKGVNFFSAIFIQFAAYFLCGALGWLIHLAYYRSNKVMRWAITLVPLALISLVIAWNGQSNGHVFFVIGEFLGVVMGLAGDVPNPLLGTLSLLVLAAGICAVNYLLIRRAPLKN